MSGMLFFSNLVIPVFILFVILYGAIEGIDLFDSFIKGAKKGFRIVFEIMPVLIGLMMAVSVFRESGLLQLLCDQIEKITKYVFVPGPVIPVIVIRLFSSSAALSFFFDILKQYGPDSYEGQLSAVFLSCSEALFYTVSIYYGAVKIKQTRWTIPGALAATMAGLIASVFLVKYM